MGMISMIPFGLLAGFAEFEKNAEKEIRIIGIEEERFCFRLAEWKINPSAFRLCFYEMEKKAYREIKITDFEIEKICREEFWTEIFVRVKSLPEFRDAVQKLIIQYDRYIRLKLECSEAEVSKALMGYPAELDEIHTGSLREQKNRWFGEAEYGYGQDQKLELALELDQPCLYERYLDNPIEELTRLYWRENGLENFCLASDYPDRLYIGNAFCPLLFPETEILMQILDKMKAESLGITLVFSYLRQEKIEEFESLLDALETWCRKNREHIEIAVNDWAAADLVRKRTEYLSPCLGILLNKRRKDPRGRYQQKQFQQIQEIYQIQKNQQNNVYAEFYREFLREKFGIQRYEWESVSGLPESSFPGSHNSLHFPFYQTNTSQYCTLYAGCVHGDRGKQTLVTDCPKFCTRFAYLYPEHLKMVGRGNSLFGFDDRILQDLQDSRDHKTHHTDKINKAHTIPDGIDRLVVNLMEAGE